MTSDTKFDAAEQRMILDHVSRGLWPLYAAASDSVRTSVAFQHDGAITVETVTEAGYPMALGGNVLDIASYLGHAPVGYGASAEAVSPLQRK